jgi:hypothetical protein
MIRDLVMTFSDVKGGKFTLRLKNVKEEITEVEISELMDVVVASNLFKGKNGAITAKENAAIVETNKTQYEV